MENQNPATTFNEINTVDVDYHFQAARRLRSAEAHKLFNGLLRGLLSPFGDFKTRYFLALSRTA